MVLTQRQRALKKLKTDLKEGRISRQRFKELRSDRNLKPTDFEGRRAREQDRTYTDIGMEDGGLYTKQTVGKIPTSSDEQRVAQVAKTAKKESDFVARSERDQAIRQARENLRPVGAPTTGERFTQNELSRLALVPGRSRPGDTVSIVREERPEPGMIYYNDPDDISPRERRVRGVMEKEERLQQGKDQLYLNLGIKDNPEQNFAVRTGKAAARFPIELASLPVIVGGRAAAGAEAAFYSDTRPELFQAAKETPRALAESLDPRTPEGLVNLAATVFAVRSLGKARVRARAKPEITLEESVTTRTTTDNFVYDETYIDVTASKGTEIATVKGRATQTFTKAREGVFDVKGKGELIDLGTRKVTGFESKGVAIEQPGGFDTLTATRSGQSRFLDYTKTAEVISEPTQVFKSVTIGQEVIGTRVQPRSFSTSTTGEIYVESALSKTGRSIFRKDILSESGKQIAVEQTLSSDSFGLDAKSFGDAFETIRGRDYTRTFYERQRFSNELSSDSLTGSQQIVTLNERALPTQTETVTRIAQRQAIKSVSRGTQKAVLRETASTGISLSSLRSSLRTRSVTKQQARPRVDFDTRPSIRTQPITSIKTDTLGITQTRTLPGIKTIPTTRTIPTSKTIIQSKPLTLNRLTTSITPSSLTVQNTIIKGAAMKSPNSKTPSVPPLPSIKLNFSDTSTSSSKGVKRRSKFTKSFTTGLLDLKTPKLDDDTFFTGLEVR